MYNTVFTGPDSTANLTELFRQTPLGTGMLCAVVPDLRSVTAMERHLARLSGETSLGQCVYTMDGLSRAILSYGGNVSETIGNHVKRALLAEIVKSRIGDRSKFYRVSDYPGFVSLLVSFLENIRSGNSEMGSRNLELISIAKAYNSHLNRLGVTDHEGAVLSALEGSMVKSFAESFSGPLIVDGFYDLTGKQFELISRLFKSFGRSAITVVNDRSRPSLFSLPARLISKYEAVGAKVVEVDWKPSSLPELVLSGFMRDKYNSSERLVASVDSGDVEIHMFQSHRSEADWIAGKIRTLLIDEACYPEDIMIVSRNAPDFCSPLYKALKRHGIPFENGASMPVVSHPLVKLILDALEASIHPDEENILNVQRSCYTGKRTSGEYLPGEIDDERAWSCMIAEVDSPEGFVGSMKKMLAWLNIKENLDGSGEINIAVFESFVYERLIQLLDEFACFYASFRPMLRAEEFSRLLRLFLGGVSLLEGSSSGRGVLFFDVNHARYLKRDVVFLTNLDNDSFPSIYDEYTLHDLKIAEKIREHMNCEEGLLFYMSIDGAKRLYLTFPGIDDEGKDDSKSPYLKEIQEGIASWSKPFTHSGIPGAAWENGYVDEWGKSENIIRALKDSGDFAGSLLSSLRLSDNAVSRAVEYAIRSHIYHVEVQDMNLSADDTKEYEARKWGDECIFPITGLEQYIFCPVKFFLNCILGLKQERRMDDGLDALELGSAIHEIVTAFYLNRQLETGRTIFSKHECEENKKLMEKIVENVLMSNAEIFKRLHPVILGSERRYIQRWMNSFIDLEANVFDNSPFSPHLFEITFGSGHYETLELSYEENTFKVKGRIDRIDISEDEHGSYFRVIDYKTGQKTSKKDISEGRAIQLPLYIKAVKENILPEHLFESGMYYILKEANYDTIKKKLKGCTIIDSEIDEIIETSVKSAVEAALSIRNGLFPAPEKCSDYCEWRPLCRGGRVSQEERIYT